MRGERAPYGCYLGDQMFRPWLKHDNWDDAENPRA